MAVEDLVDSEIGIAAAVTAVAVSPRVRGYVRTGLVYSLAGVLKAGDVLLDGASRVGGAVSSAVSDASDASHSRTAAARPQGDASRTGARRASPTRSRRRASSSRKPSRAANAQTGGSPRSKAATA